MSLQSLPEDYTALVQGASRGIGLALVARLCRDRRAGRVIATCRHPRQATTLQEWSRKPGSRLQLVELDITRPESIAAAARMVEESGLAPSLVVNVAGLLHQGKEIQPEKRLEDLDMATLSRVFAVNVLGPAVFMRHFLPLMNSEGRAIMTVLSARVGSISDNRLGGWYGYRASKAALNQMIRTAAIEARRRFPAVILAALHPGTTDTDLSTPFQSRVPAGKLFTPDYVADCLLRVMEGLDFDDSGGFFAWDGEPIPW